MPKQRILLVEDDADVGPIIALVLRGEGYDVDVAPTVAEAHACLDNLVYAAVVADLRLPDGDGLAIADRAAECGAKTAIMSGYLHQLPPPAADRHALLIKPLRPSELLDALCRLIGAPPAGASSRDIAWQNSGGESPNQKSAAITEIKA